VVDVVVLLLDFPIAVVEVVLVEVMGVCQDLVSIAGRSEGGYRELFFLQDDMDRTSPRTRLIKQFTIAKFAKSAVQAKW
jgi:hypothetical protein